MRSFWISLILVFSAGLAMAWDWGLNHRLTYLSRDYAFLMGKNALIEGYSRPGLAVFGDSMVMDGILPEKLGPGVINCALNGCTPIESYFMIRRLMKASVHPQAILLSYNAYHFVHPDFYWENTVKFGVIKGTEADEVMGYILKWRDKELLLNSSPWDLEQRLYSFLLSRGFPSYYISSLYAEPFGARKKENEEALKIIAQTRGQYYFPMADGSKELNADTRLKAFTVSPVIDHYFRETLDLCEKAGIPVYFYAMPINESSVPHLDPGVYKAYQDYLESLTKTYSHFHILSNLRPIYPWRLFSDYAHLNEKGASRFNREFARILNQSSVPGGPYGSKK
jgi:hypothetical protein